MAQKADPLENLVERGMSLAQAKAVHARYLAGEPVECLLVELGIDIHKVQFSRLFLRLPAEQQCPHCKVPMLEDLPSKTDRTSHRCYCVSCNHQNIPRCPCGGCREETNRALTNQFYEALKWEGGEPVLLNNLTALERLALYGLMNRPDEDDMITPLYEGAPLMPTMDASLDLLRALLARKIIFPVPRRNMGTAIRIEQGQVIAQYGYFHWMTNVGLMHDDVGLGYDDLKDQLAQWFHQIKTEPAPAQMREILQLMKSIAIDEAWRVITELSDALSFDADQRGGKLEQLVDQNAIKFPPGQFHYFCTKSVRDGYLAYKENRANSRRHAINLVPWRMERLLERCENEGWEIRPYSEPKPICRLEPLVTEVLSTALGLGYSMATHSALAIEAAMREAGYLPTPQVPA